MRQLEPADAIFLSMETPDTPAVIGGLALLDPTTADRFDFDGFTQFVAERLSLCPRFSYRLAEVPFGLDLPYWVDDGPFNVEHHVHALGVPAPGGTHELSELASLLFTQSLDRNRPLWEMFWIEGLQGGRVALLWKVHHCLLDGMSGAGLIEQLFDLEPRPAAAPLVPIGDQEEVGGAPGFFDMLKNGTANALRRPVSLGRHLSNAGAAAIETLRSGGSEALASAPAASINGVIGARRSVAWTTLPFDAVKEIKDAFGVTVNDVLLELTGSSLRRYLESRDELPEEPLTAVVPMSTRSAGDLSLGNQITEVPVSWATHLEDPVERLLKIHDNATRAKRNATESSAPALLPAMAESLAPGFVGALMRVTSSMADKIPLPGNAVVSNVRSTEVPLYIAGARIAGMVPMSLLAPTQGLNFTIISYAGELHVGVTVDPDLVKEPWALAEGVPKALLDLQAAADELEGPAV